MQVRLDRGQPRPPPASHAAETQDASRDKAAINDIIRRGLAGPLGPPSHLQLREIPAMGRHNAPTPFWRHPRQRLRQSAPEPPPVPQSRRKRARYTPWHCDTVSKPLAVETTGVLGPAISKLLAELGSRITAQTGEKRETYWDQAADQPRNSARERRRHHDFNMAGGALFERNLRESKVGDSDDCQGETTIKVMEGATEGAKIFVAAACTSFRPLWRQLTKKKKNSKRKTAD
ncbi:hypothetical protein GWK47_035529 [Chionoecetes opilio]|uniref:Uncharacterized protein n=1 Tax=Chionoecetes opilio TaxID=41210 RepID=A0A8J4YN70_CHIOP|nr:hypothetical protein GWK47_035529 [Chionoecetes opilio]